MNSPYKTIHADDFGQVEFSVRLEKSPETGEKSLFVEISCPDGSMCVGPYSYQSESSYNEVIDNALMASVYKLGSLRSRGD